MSGSSFFLYFVVFLVVHGIESVIPSWPENEVPSSFVVWTVHEFLVLLSNCSALVSM